MNVQFIKAEPCHLHDCSLALQNSELGRVYFSGEDSADKAIQEGISKGEITLAINENNICLGFLWVIINGAFHSFPYLHIIAIKEQYRGTGIGKKLLNYFEESSKSSKLFLVVADFNPRAKKLYESMGYIEIGVIPNLYKEGVNECFMMKVN